MKHIKYSSELIKLLDSEDSFIDNDFRNNFKDEIIENILAEFDDPDLVTNEMIDDRLQHQKSFLEEMDFYDFECLGVKREDYIESELNLIDNLFRTIPKLIEWKFMTE